MVDKWREVKLGEIAEIYDGPHATPKKTDSGPIFLGISNLSRGLLDLSNTEHISENDFHRWTHRVEPEEGDVVFSYETRLGEAAWIPHGLRCCLGRRMGLLRARVDLVDPRFLLYAYLGPDFQDTLYSRTVHGSTVDRIPLINMPHFPIVIPGNIQEQRRIAHILGTLDDKIENNRKTAKTLEAMAQAIFKSWFVDFDPVRAKMAGESRESICKRLKLTPEILDLFPDRLVASELGEIPEGWGVGTFGDYADIVGGSTPSTNNSAYWLSGIHSWATPKDLSSLTMPVLLATENKITDAGLQQVSSRLLPVGTVLLSSRAPIGYLAIAEIPVAINQGFIALKPHNNGYCIFLLFLIKHNMEEIISRANGSTFLEISKAKFRPIPVVSPAQDILQSFAKLTMPLFLRIVSLEKITLILANGRDALLPKLISGEIRVPESEHLLKNSEG